MAGCIAWYSTGDSTSVVSRTVGSVRISCNDVGAFCMQVEAFSVRLYRTF